MLSACESEYVCINLSMVRPKSRAPRRGVMSLPASFDWAFIIFSIQKLLESASQPPFLATNVRSGTAALTDCERRGLLLRRGE